LKKKKEKILSPDDLKPKPFWAFVLVGLAAGVFAGLFGKGGGLVIVPLLIGIFHYDPKKAAATSLAALQLLLFAKRTYLCRRRAFGHYECVLIAAGIVIGVFLVRKSESNCPLQSLKKCMLSFYLQ
jgi:uncharacterized membrane protein YfcA